MANVNPIRRLLIANRGEIARRIIRTAHAMGIGTVAVYSDNDATAPFVQEADTAIAIGGNTATESYLDAGKLIEACKRLGPPGAAGRVAAKILEAAHDKRHSGE